MESKHGRARGSTFSQRGFASPSQRAHKARRSKGMRQARNAECGNNDESKVVVLGAPTAKNQQLCSARPCTHQSWSANNADF
jgi:hypothetical protein